MIWDTKKGPSFFAERKDEYLKKILIRPACRAAVESMRICLYQTICGKVVCSIRKKLSFVEHHITQKFDVGFTDTTLYPIVVEALCQVSVRPVAFHPW